MPAGYSSGTYRVEDPTAQSAIAKRGILFNPSQTAGESLYACYACYAFPIHLSRCRRRISIASDTCMIRVVVQTPSITSCRPASTRALLSRTDPLSLQEILMRP